MLITKKFAFDSAHKLNNYNGKCKNLHGHTYTLKITVKGKVDKKTGMVTDFYILKKVVNKYVIDILDHSMLNDIVKQPTAENLAIWIWNQLNKKINLSEIELWETPDSYVTYNGK